jgi:hypothetical protein
MCSAVLEIINPSQHELVVSISHVLYKYAGVPPIPSEQIMECMINTWTFISKQPLKQMEQVQIEWVPVCAVLMRWCQHVSIREWQLKHVLHTRKQEIIDLLRHHSTLPDITHQVVVDVCIDWMSGICDRDMKVLMAELGDGVIAGYLMRQAAGLMQVKWQSQ